MLHRVRDPSEREALPPPSFIVAGLNPNPSPSPHALSCLGSGHEDSRKSRKEIMAMDGMEYVLLGRRPTLNTDYQTPIYLVLPKP